MRKLLLKNRQIIKHRKKIFLTAIGIIVVGGIFLIWRTLQSTETQADPKIGEVVERTRQTNTAFMGRSENGARKYAATSNLGPINYMDSKGDWHEYDFTLVESHKDGYKYQLASSDYQVYFRSTLKNSPTVKIERDKRHMHMHPTVLKYINTVGDEEVVSQLNIHAQAQVTDNTITYKDAYGQGIDLMFTVSTSGVKKEVVIHTDAALPQPTITDAHLEVNINFEVSDDIDIYASETGSDKSIWEEGPIQPKGTIEFKDSNPSNIDRNYDGTVDSKDEIIFKSQPAVVHDSGDTKKIIDSDTGDIVLILSKIQDQKSFITSVRTPYTWLQDAVYPVYIDPSVGPNSPGTITQEGASTPAEKAWSNISNIGSSDDSYATVGLSNYAPDAGSITNQLIATNFGFTIPVGSTIDGIVVEWEKRGEGTAPLEDLVSYIVKNNITGSTNKSLPGNWPGTDTYSSYGGSSDLWGETWSAADINSSEFGAALSLQCLNGICGIGGSTAYVDHVRVTVYYTESEPTIANWLDDSWSKRVKVTINSSQVASNVTDFPVYVDLSDLPADFHTNVNQTDARDIRVTTSDGTTEVPREVVFYDSGTDTGELHFKAPSLSSTSDTDFYIYYGNSSATEPAASATYGSQNVWSNSYVFVSHDGGLNDSTSNAYTATNNNSTLSSSGKLGESRSYNGTNSYTALPNITSQFSTEATITGWTQLVVATPTNDTKTGLWWFGNSSANNTHWAWSNGLGYFSTFRNTRVDEITPLGGVDRTNWHHLAVTTTPDINGWKMYQNASLIAQTTGLSSVYMDTNTYLGKSYGSYYLDGSIDEIRISNTARTANWIQTEYNNQNSPATFYSLGSFETGTTSAPENFALTIVKECEDEMQEFDFDIFPFAPPDSSIATPTLGCGESSTPIILSQAVIYDVLEDIPEGWELEDIQCTGGDPGVVFNYTEHDNGVRITTPGLTFSSIVCTFSNQSIAPTSTPTLTHTPTPTPTPSGPTPIVTQGTRLEGLRVEGVRID